MIHLGRKKEIPPKKMHPSEPLVTTVCAQSKGHLLCLAPHKIGILHKFINACHCHNQHFRKALQVIWKLGTAEGYIFFLSLPQLLNHTFEET